MQQTKDASPQAPGKAVPQDTGWLIRFGAQSLATVVAAQVTTLLTFLYVARTLGSSVLGEIAIVTSFSALIGSVASLGLPPIITRRVATIRADNPALALAVVRRSMALTVPVLLVSTAITLVMGRFVAEAFYGSADALSLLVAGVAAAGGVAVFTLLLAAVQGLSLIRAVNVARLGVAVGTLLLTVVLSSWLGAIGAILALVVTPVIFLAPLLLTLTRAGPTRESAGKDEPNRIKLGLFRESLPSLLSGLPVLPVGWLMASFLVFVSSFGELGQYQTALRLVAILSLFPIAIGTPFLPLASEAAAGSPETANRITRRAYRTFSVFLLPPLCGLATAGPLVLAPIFGPDFEAAGAYLPYLALGAYLLAISSLFSSYAVATRRMWWSAAANLAWAVVMVTTAAYLAPRMGAFGLSVANLLASSVIFLVISWMLMRSAGLKVGNLLQPLAVATSIFLTSVLLGSGIPAGPRWAIAIGANAITLAASWALLEPADRSHLSGALRSVSSLFRS